MDLDSGCLGQVLLASAMPAVQVQASLGCRLDVPRVGAQQLLAGSIHHRTHDLHLPQAQSVQWLRQHGHPGTFPQNVNAISLVLEVSGLRCGQGQSARWAGHLGCRHPESRPMVDLSLSVTLLPQHVAVFSAVALEV